MRLRTIVLLFEAFRFHFDRSLCGTQAEKPKQGWMDKEIEQRRTDHST